MKRISEDIKEAKNQIVDAVLNHEDVTKLRQELETLLAVGSAQDVLIHTVKKHFDKVGRPTRDELHNKIESLLDNAPQDFLEYRQEVYGKVEMRVSFRIPSHTLKRGECNIG